VLNSEHQKKREKKSDRSKHRTWDLLLRGQTLFRYATKADGDVGLAVLV